MTEGVFGDTTSSLEVVFLSLFGTLMKTAL
jgi:hypothetical protein